MRSTIRLCLDPRAALVGLAHADSAGIAREALQDLLSASAPIGLRDTRR